MGVENVAAKAATVETASLSNQGLVMMQKDLLTKSGSSNDSKDNTINSSDSALSVLDSGTESENRTQFLSSHLSKMMNKGFDPGKVDKPANKLRQLDAGFEEVQEPDSAKDAAQISSKYARQPQNQRSVSSKLAQLAESFEANPQQKAVVQRYIQSYFAYLMSDDPKVRARMKSDEDALMKSGLKQEQIFSLQKQVRTAARADISVRIKENLLKGELSGSKVESAFTTIATNDSIGSAFNNQKLGGWNFGGALADLQSDVNKSLAQNKNELSGFLLQDLEEQMVSKMVKGDEDVSDLNKHINTLMKMGVNVLSWLKDEWTDKKFDMGLVQTSVVPEENTGMIVDLNSDGQGRGERGDAYQQQSDGEIMIGQLRSLYVQRLINGGGIGNLHISFKIRKLKNGLLKMGAFSREFEDKIAFEAEAIAKKKIMDMLEEAMIERAGLFKLKGKAYEAHDKKVKQLLKAAERLGMNVGEEDLVRIRESVNLRMTKIITDQIETMKSMMARRGSSRKAEKALANLEALNKRLLQELGGGTPAEADGDGPTEEKISIAGEEDPYV